MENIAFMIFTLCSPYFHIIFTFLVICSGQMPMYVTLLFKSTINSAPSLVRMNLDRAPGGVDLALQTGFHRGGHYYETLSTICWDPLILKANSMQIKL